MKLIKNDKLECQIADVAEVAGYLWQRGWAERNGGNISVNVTDLLTDEVRTGVCVMSLRTRWKIWR